ncbi:MAG: metallophosphoesterase family protein [Candidatus Dormibacteria bacterium]
MKVAVLSDIHSNLLALDAVLEALPPVDTHVFLGDLVGYGARPNECVQRIRELNCAVTLCGNHDWAVHDPRSAAMFHPEAARAVDWTRSVLSEENFAYLRSLTPSASWHDLLLVHASPRDPLHEYVLNAGVAQECLRSEFRVCLFGHTHVPAVYRATGNRVRSEDARGEVELRGRVMLNPGSVGQPRDGDPRAAFVVLDLDRATAHLTRVAYDVAGTQHEIHDAGLPDWFALRLSAGL